MEEGEEEKFMTNISPVFIIGRPKPQIIFDGKVLEQVNQILTKVGVKSRMVRYQSRTIGIAEASDSSEKIVATVLGTDGNEQIKYHETPNKDI